MDIYLAWRARQIADRYDIIWANSEKVAIPLSFLNIKKKMVVILQYPESPLRAILIRLSGMVKTWDGVGIVARDARKFVQESLGVEAAKIFQYFAAREDHEALKALTDHVIARHYPEISGPLALISAVAERQAKLIARWMSLGFIHGVMNTDNMAISGETIDYGPCAFMDAFDPAAVFSSIDQMGRYAFGNQPRIALWNLTRLAECLLSLFADDETAAIEIAKAELGEYATVFDTTMTAGMAATTVAAAAPSVGCWTGWKTCSNGSRTGSNR